jgi:hypothetical protein
LSKSRRPILWKIHQLSQKPNRSKFLDADCLWKYCHRIDKAQFKFNSKT